MKQKKREAKLKRRQADYDNMDKKQGYTRPGSVRK